ncbi:MAG: hypothetical protein WCK18_09405 [Prolixibacteraceae bacterium]
MKNSQRNASFKPVYPNPIEIPLPFLQKAPVIDGNLNEWKDYAYHDGVWDIYRVSHSYWYRPDRNRLTDHGNEPGPEDDLQSRYYIGWDNTYLYLGAEVHDNVNDISDPNHQPQRWFYKDCISWFLEAPCDTVSETFGQGDNAFCFVIDVLKPDYGAWWRHGTGWQSYIEEPLPKKAVNYEICMNPWGQSPADYILEARVNMAMTFAISDQNWRPPKIGDIYSLEIVHTDPDGGNYGGHLVIYGTGDDDNSWGKVILAGPQKPIERRRD